MSTTEHKPAALRLADDRPWQQVDDLYSWAIDAEDMLRSLYAENYALRARVQELGELARNNNSRRVVELEAQLEAIGAGGVGPLRKRQDHVEDDLEMLARRGCEIDERYAHHLAIELECMLIDPDGNWDSAAKTLDTYKQAWEEINPTPSPFLVEGGIPPERKAIYAAIQAKRAAAGQTDRKELA